MALPHFFLIGPPKAATTALHGALAAHPRLHLSAMKEPKYFLCGDRPPPRAGGPGDAHSYREWVWRRADYEALFDDAPPGTLRGESTPFYLSDVAAKARIAAELPQAKLIVVLRDPVDRAYSNWTHLWSDGLEPEGDFITACDLEERRLRDGWAPFWQYTGLGRYGQQLRHLLSLFPREQVHLLRYRDLVARPAEVLDGICTFLGVETGVVTEVPRANVSTYVDRSPLSSGLGALARVGAEVGQHFPPQLWRKISGPLLEARRGRQKDRPELAGADRNELVSRLADDIALLEDVTGWPFDDWRGHRTGGTYSVRSSCAPSARVTS